VEKTASDREKERISTAAGLLHLACRPLPILSTLAWPPAVKETFLARAPAVRMPLPGVSRATQALGTIMHDQTSPCVAGRWRKRSGIGMLAPLT
jgi:hypothetical protein